MPSLQPTLKPSLRPNPRLSTEPSAIPSLNTSDEPSSEPEDGEVVTVGDNNLPADKFPLGKCQGDCDNIGDCQEGLQCFWRDGLKAVPGCTGRWLLQL
jgi:hypothetical protein